jgi:hypothetical protein
MTYTYKQDTLDLPVSQFWSREVQAKDKECYHNALNVLWALPPVLAQGAHYVEGWAVGGPLPLTFGHGWVELADGRIIDPTPTWCSGDHKRSYFAGRRYTVKDVATAIHNGVRSLPLDEVLNLDMVPHDLEEVYEEAFRFAHGDEAYYMLRRTQFQPQEESHE